MPCPHAVGAYICRHCDRELIAAEERAACIDVVRGVLQGSWSGHVDILCVIESRISARGPKDCGDNSCRYAKNKGGMRTNGGHCRCDDCEECGEVIRPELPWRRKHRKWCSRFVTEEKK